MKLYKIFGGADSSQRLGNVAVVSSGIALLGVSASAVIFIYSEFTDDGTDPGARLEIANASAAIATLSVLVTELEANTKDDAGTVRLDVVRLESKLAELRRELDGIACLLRQHLKRDHVDKQDCDVAGESGDSGE